MFVSYCRIHRLSLWCTMMTQSLLPIPVPTILLIIPITRRRWVPGQQRHCHMTMWSGMCSASLEGLNSSRCITWSSNVSSTGVLHSVLCTQFSLPVFCHFLVFCCCFFTVLCDVLSYSLHYVAILSVHFLFLLAKKFEFSVDGSVSCNWMLK